MNRAEPRSMTLVDAMALVAGVAAALASMVRMPRIIAFLTTPDPVAGFLWDLRRFGLGAALAVSMVAAVRVVRYRRMPRMAEWLGILTTLILFSDWPEERIAFWLYSPSMFPRFSFTVLGGIKAGIFLAVATMILGVVRLGRGVFPAWIKAALLVVVALLLHGGPLREFGYRAAELVAEPARVFDTPGIRLYRETCVFAAWLPMGVFFGVPAVGAVAQRIRRQPWTWIEWASTAPALLVWTSSTMLAGRWFFDLSSGYYGGLGPAWLRVAERVAIVVWLATTICISIITLNHFSLAWRAWVGESDQPGGADPVESPPESTP